MVCILARAKKNAKKVRISPEVDKQEMEKKKEESKRPSRPSTPAKEGRAPKKAKESKEETDEEEKKNKNIPKKDSKDSEGEQVGEGASGTRSFDINDFFSGVNYLPSSLVSLCPTLEDLTVPKPIISDS